MPKKLAPLRILVVEDDWLLANEVAAWLGDEEISVVGPVGSPAQAERLADSDVIDAAVVDFNLHGESAESLIVALIERDIKIVVLSGYTHPCEVGGNIIAVLEKPCSKCGLIRALQVIR